MIEVIPAVETPPESLPDAARWWAERGRRVLPNDGKRPCIREWQHEATSSPQQIEWWWRRWPAANPGTTLDNEVVVDLDPRNSPLDTAEAMVAALADQAMLLGRAPWHRTGSGGLHVVYRAPEGTPAELFNGKKLGVPGVDLKAGAGAQIILPPSVTEGRYSVLGGSLLNLTEAPDWLTAVVQPSPNGQRTESSGNRLDLAAMFQGVPEGERDGRFWRYASSLRGRNVHIEEARALVEAAWQRADPGRHPFPLDKALGQLDRAYAQYEPNQPETAPAPSAPPQPLAAGTSILADVEALLRRYVVFVSDAQVVATALWVAHTHAIEAADTTPYLWLQSPTKRSGKTRVQEVVELLVARPWFVTRPTEATLFRVIDERQPTLLVDEVDTLFGRDPTGAHEGLRAVLNSGHRRGAVVPRCVQVGNKQVVTDFKVFSAKALAGIGWLPETVADRSIPVRLRRKAPGEGVERFRFKKARAEGHALRDRLAGWAQTAMPRLVDAEPELPEGLNDRAADGWEPLFAIADLAGGEWSERARKAALQLHGGSEDEGEGVLLLAHVRDAFYDRPDTEEEPEKEPTLPTAPEAPPPADRLPTTALLTKLVGRSDGPWAEKWERILKADPEAQGPANQLARLLKPFGVKPKRIRTGGRGTPTPRGYLREDLADAWARYLPTTTESDDA